MARRTLSVQAMKFLKRNVGKIPDLSLSKKLHVSIYTVAKVREGLGIRVHRGRPRTPRKDVEAIFALRRGGLKVVSIAKRYDVSRQRIYQVLSRNKRGGRRPIVK